MLLTALDSRPQSMTWEEICAAEGCSIDDLLAEQPQPRNRFDTAARLHAHQLYIAKLR